ncbi:MAG: glucose-6-phosphate dehydrogenase assembly protein OpcA [Verrucomicrobia bacterium]|nr:glucose-6-phosphate dehydrogenase assembly protein OpcA [Verrucomicrobiota bacterium]MBV9273596.1 glucose-6-phosphate dehydrogenase assembly protein OpcA [Verrucomicrobiota bacterium]
MPAAAKELTRGMPIEIGNINRSLTQLWEQEGTNMVKASLVNFAVYSEAADALTYNTRLMEEITREHACRIILLAVNPAAQKHRVQAWISAHCHLSGSGDREVCSEQIAFLLEGMGPETMRNVLFSHLDSDLPLYLWWQGQFSGTLDPQLWSWVDRFIFDSYSWREPTRQIRILRESVAGTGSRCVLCDLNWRRLIYLRLAIAQMFDQPWATGKLREIREVSIVYHPEYRTTAVLLAAWLAGQLGWRLEKALDAEFRFSPPGSIDPVVLKLTAVPGEWIGEVQLRFADGSEFNLNWSGKFLESGCSDFQGVKQLLPAGGTTIADLVNEELMRGGEHRSYLRALGLAERLWGVGNGGGDQ